jgi:hypothetical protein
MLSTIYKTVVASGSISAGAALIDSTTANAFVGGVDVSAYRNGNYQIHLYQAATGKLAWGWISATAPGGETLDVEKLNDPGFDDASKWAEQTNWIVNDGGSSKAVSSGANTGFSVYQTCSTVTKDGLFLASVVVSDYTSGTLRMQGGSTQPYKDITTTETANLYFTSFEAVNNVMLKSQTLFIGACSSFSLKRVTMPAATGALLLSTKAGSRGFAQDTGINPNAAMTYTIYGEFKANGNAGYVR